MQSMNLFIDNWEWFKQRGLIEKALLEARTNQKITYGWSETVKWFLSAKSDRAQLLRYYDPLPPGDIFKLYRGVPKSGDRWGVAWTTSLDIARFFANRSLSGKGGTVYTTTVKREDVYTRPQGQGRPGPRCSIESQAVRDSA
jgi:hypothetical protein